MPTPAERPAPEPCRGSRCQHPRSRDCLGRWRCMPALRTLALL